MYLNDCKKTEPDFDVYGNRFLVQLEIDPVEEEMSHLVEGDEEEQNKNLVRPKMFQEVLKIGKPVLTDPKNPPAKWNIREGDMVMISRMDQPDEIIPTDDAIYYIFSSGRIIGKK